MDKNMLQKYFFTTALFLVSVLIFFMFLPFLEVIVLSTIFAIVLSPLHRKVTKWFNGRSGLAAFVMIVLFAVVIIVPAFFLTTQILSQANGLYIQLTNQTEFDYIYKVTHAIEKPIQNFYPEFSFDLGQYVGVGTDLIINHLSTIVSSVFNIVTGIILIFISLYFFLKDGFKFKKILVNLSPLNNEYDEHIFGKIKQTIISTVKGVILIALIQGFLAGLGMKLFGVPNATLWGSVSAVASLVPGLGTAIIFIPAVSYMFIIGNTPFALGLLLWGVVIVGLVDNFLGPYLYSRGVQIHQLIMLFAVLGGLSLFGPIGFIFGPIIVALLFALIEIYQTLILEKKSL
jgi:predicted PurR-regulated permease PerM